MSIQSIDTAHLSALQTAADIHEMFRRLGYPVDAPDPFEGDDLDALELSPVDRENVKRAYVVSQLENHIVFLYEVEDLRTARLRALAWNILQRGTGLLVVTTPIERGIYREILFVDPRFAGKPNKSSVRVNKLEVVVAEPTRHDLDTLNAIHAHRRSGQQVYDAQGAAFNVTAITKRFYDTYHDRYERAKAAIQKANPGVADFYDADKLHAFTQRLLGRLMFLYFLQRKGWLGERPRFLTDTYRANQQRHAGEMHDGDTFHYYREVLEPLFFETMNTKRPGDITRWEGIRIPYLNGGLFDEARDPAGPILIPDAIFDPNDVNGLLGFFNRYNFTIADDTPLEQDVAVDPEMLGKVFENLLEERDRGQSGSFYTPRPIVAYMCQEALAGYLEESAALPRERTRALFDPDAETVLSADEAQRIDAALDTLTVLDPAVGSGSFLIGMLNEILRLRRAAYAAQHYDPEPDTQTLSDWKEAIIRDTLYGVDIKPEAIEIAQLRLWLALVVDQTLEQARPLPNLDYKLMAGNSLIETIDGEPVLGELATQILSADDSTPVAWDAVRDQLQMFDPNPTQARMLLFEGEKEAHHERIKLDEMRREYFSATPERRKELKPEIMAQERQIVAASLREKADAAQAVIDEMGRRAGLAGGKLKASDERKLNAANDKLARLTRLQEDMAKPDATLPFFLYRLHFSEVFERKSGFDIVVANPPYVRQEMFRSQKPELEASFPDVYAGTADLYVYFFARATNLLRAQGQLAFITTNKFLQARYGKGLRAYLKTRLTLKTLINFGDMQVFDATSYPLILLASKTVPKVTSAFRVLLVKSLDVIEDLPNAVANAFRVQSEGLPEDTWIFVSPEDKEIANKIERAGKTLEDYVGGRAFYGIKTGLNAGFEIDEKTKAELIEADPRLRDVIKPWLRGRSIGRWRQESTQSWLLYIPWKFPIKQYPVLEQHLELFRDQLSARAEAKIGRHPWYALNRYASDYFQEFDKPKIVYQVMQVQHAFTMDTAGHYLNNSVWMICAEDYFLLGILNSSVGWYEISRKCTPIQNGYQLIWDYFKNVRIPTPPADLRERIAAVAQRCLDAAQDNPDRLHVLEAELNALVYEAYGLDADDIAVIEGSLGGSSTSAEPADDEDDE